MMRVFIVEDEPPAVERLIGFLDLEKDVEIIGTSADGVAAAREINRLRPDLVFLDIHLPDISGLDVLRILECQPAVVFTTAYDQYAVKAFELNAADYLLKPFDYARLHQAVRKVRQGMSSAKENVTADQLKKLLSDWQPDNHCLNRIPSKRGDKIHILQDDQVAYIASENKLVFAFTADGKHLLNYTLDELQERLDRDKFFRIHRSTVVNLNFIKTIESYFGGGYRITLKDISKDRTSAGGKTDSQLTVSRAAGKQLRQLLGW